MLLVVLHTRLALDYSSYQSSYQSDDTPDTAPDADDALVAASPEVIRARLAADQAALDLARATVVAPLAGTLTALDVTLGNHVTGGTAVATVATLDDILAEVRIDEVDVGKFRLGQPVVLTTDSVRDVELQGRIVLIPPTVIYGVAQLTQWPGLISLATVRLAFLLSFGTGLVFGLCPASRAARMDPVEALRHE